MCNFADMRINAVVLVTQGIGKRTRAKLSLVDIDMEKLEGTRSAFHVLCCALCCFLRMCVCAYASQISPESCACLRLLFIYCAYVYYTAPINSFCTL